MSAAGISKSTFLAILSQQKKLETLTPAQQDALLRVAISAHMHGVLAGIANKQSPLLLPRPLTRHFSSVNTFSFAQKTQVIASVTLLSEQLLSANVPVLLLKGAAYILGNKHNAHGRLISDIDILVQQDALKVVESVLHQHGWRAKQLNDYDEKYYREWSHELPPYVHNQTGVTLDIHHNLIPSSSGKTVNISELHASKVEVGNNVYIPSDGYLILHSAIHLLLNDDTEKGLRDCFDLHSLIQNYLLSKPIESLRSIFIDANCDAEFSVLIHLLNRVFADQYHTILLASENLTPLSWHEKMLVSSLYKTVFPQTQHLLDNASLLARQHVYVHGHLSKMPMRLFIKHISYKSYRSMVKRLLGETFFQPSTPKK